MATNAQQRQRRKAKSTKKLNPLRTYGSSRMGMIATPSMWSKFVVHLERSPLDPDHIICAKPVKKWSSFCFLKILQIAR